MNSSKKVDSLVSEWKQSGLEKEQIVVNCCEAELDWPYVFGACAAQCTPSKRKSYASLKNCPEAEKKVICSTCAVLSGKQAKCDGCKWFPGGERVLIDDCWGFVKQIMSRVDIKLSGYGCTSGWNSKTNWSQKGTIGEMPNVVCCVFYDKDGTKEHVGIHIGDGKIIHCSGTVKYGSTNEKIWTHYAIPVGMEGGTPVPDVKPTLRKGSNGEYVTLLQTKLIQLGYDLSPYGADGSFGNKTLDAVKAFQKDHDLSPDGVVGKATWSALDSAEPGKVYSVSIPHLTYFKAEALVKEYPGASMVEEGR